MDKPIFKKSKEEYLQVLENTLQNILEMKKGCYYLGGTLCFDNKEENYFTIIDLDGNFSMRYSLDNLLLKGILSDINRKKVFDIYLRVKGETSYYNEEYNKFSKEIRQKKITDILE